MRTRLALLSALVIAMAIAAIALTSSQFAFSDWPMAPGPERAEHVVVDDVTIDSADTTVVDRGDDSSDAVDGSGTRVGDSSTAPRSVRVSSRVPAAKRPARSGSDRDGQGSDDGSKSGDDRSSGDSSGSDDGYSGPTGALAGTTPAAAQPSETTAVSPAGVTATPSRTDAAANPAPAPAAPSPTPAPDPTPDPAPDPAPTPAPTTPGHGNGGGKQGRRRGLLGNLLHGLLGDRKIQS